MTKSRQALGRAGEELVARRITAAGWHLIDRNVRTRQGEIDLIACDGSCLAFIEVKAGRAGSLAGPEYPELAVGPQKQARLRRLAREWLGQHSPPPDCRTIRFDVVGITFDSGQRPVRYRHIENAF